MSPLITTQMFRIDFPERNLSPGLSFLNLNPQLNKGLRPAKHILMPNQGAKRIRYEVSIYLGVISSAQSYLMVSLRLFINDIRLSVMLTILNLYKLCLEYIIFNVSQSIFQKNISSRIIGKLPQCGTGIQSRCPSFFSSL